LASRPENVPRVVLFDLDGTLIDSEELILASYRHTMRLHLGRVPPDDEWRRGIGTPLVVQMRGFAANEEAVSAMIRTYTEHNLAHHDDLVRPFPEVRDTVRLLRTAGFALAIVTSKKSRATHLGLRRCDLPLKWFDSIVTADDVKRYKPHAEPVLRALEPLRRIPAEAVFVGDSPHDMRAGRAAGVFTAAALWGPFGRSQLEPTDPDAWLDAPGDVLALLGVLP
jgi:pyrophosphatase PpaX